MITETQTASWVAYKYDNARLRLHLVVYATHSPRYPTVAIHDNLKRCVHEFSYYSSTSKDAMFSRSRSPDKIYQGEKGQGEGQTIPDVDSNVQSKLNHIIQVC